MSECPVSLLLKMSNKLMGSLPTLRTLDIPAALFWTLMETAHQHSKQDVELPQLRYLHLRSMQRMGPTNFQASNLHYGIHAPRLESVRNEFYSSMLFLDRLGASLFNAMSGRLAKRLTSLRLINADTQFPPDLLGYIRFVASCPVLRPSRHSSSNSIGGPTFYPCRSQKQFLRNSKGASSATKILRSLSSPTLRAQSQVTVDHIVHLTFSPPS